MAAQPPWFIIGRTAKPTCLRGRLSSNVRPRVSLSSQTALSRGFEIETELTVHALVLRAPVRVGDTLFALRRAEALCIEVDPA